MFRCLDASRLYRSTNFYFFLQIIHIHIIIWPKFQIPILPDHTFHKKIGFVSIYLFKYNLSYIESLKFKFLGRFKFKTQCGNKAKVIVGEIF